MGKERGDKVLSTADACAGFVGAVFLFFIQKLPDGSDAKQLLLYSMTVVALAANNFLAIIFAWGQRKWERHTLKTQHSDLEVGLAEYSKKENPDPEVMEGYNAALKKTQMALLHNITSRADEVVTSSAGLKKSPSKNKMNNKAKVNGVDA